MLQTAIDFGLEFAVHKNMFEKARSIEWKAWSRLSMALLYSLTLAAVPEYIVNWCGLNLLN